MSAPRFTLPRLLGATTVAACALFGASGAQAQVFLETWGERFTMPLYEPAPRYRMERDRRLHPAIILDELEDRGFRNLVVVARRADVYVIEGVSPRKGRVRLVVDAYDGEIIQRDTLSRSDARVVGEDRSPTASTSSLFALPAPPVRRMPGTAIENATPKPVPPKVAGPLSEPSAAPALPATRPPSADWNPINSVPVAPLL
ncbi:MAG: PepSY domain-containing protein [Methylobacterium sp.]|nr:PepSY domain-containing protein [Methylobacterium sp.]